MNKFYSKERKTKYDLIKNNLKPNEVKPQYNLK